MKLNDRILRGIAKYAEKAFDDSMGYASRTGGYEPEMSDAMKALKAKNNSKMDKLYNKLFK